MTLPSNWRWPTKEKFLEDPISYLDASFSALADEIYAPNWRLEGQEAVAALAIVRVVAVEIDRLPANVLVSADWNTTTWITGLTTAGFTVNFGTAAPGGGGILTYVVIVPEAGPA